MTATKGPDERALADRLVILRNMTGLLQSAVAELLGVTPATISNWEIGNSQPRLLQAVALAKLYKVSLYVLTGDEPMPPATHRYRSVEAGTECASICSP